MTPEMVTAIFFGLGSLIGAAVVARNSVKKQDLDSLREIMKAQGENITSLQAENKTLHDADNMLRAERLQLSRELEAVRGENRELRCEVDALRKENADLRAQKQFFEAVAQELRSLLDKKKEVQES
jgi:cell division protein FtsB